jgi:hypothetical protein
MIVRFHAPTHSADLRQVLTAHSAVKHEKHQVAYRLQYGETRLLRWLTWQESLTRAHLLRMRGYEVKVSKMALE